MLSHSACISLNKTQVVNKGEKHNSYSKILKASIFLEGTISVSIPQISMRHKKCEGVQKGHLEYPKSKTSGRHRRLFIKI